MMHFFAHKLACLRRRRFSLFFVAFCSFHRFWFRHDRLSLSRGRVRAFNVTLARRGQQVGKSLYEYDGISLARKKLQARPK
jgi:hypothetical protein